MLRIKLINGINSSNKCNYRYGSLLDKQLNKDKDGLKTR